MRIETEYKDKVMELGIMILNKRVPLEERHYVEQIAVNLVIGKVWDEYMNRLMGLPPDHSVVERIDDYKDGKLDRMRHEACEEHRKQLAERNANCVWSEPFEISIDELCDR